MKLLVSSAFSLMFLMAVSFVGHADRLIRRSNGQIIALGTGSPDAKLETVLFKECNEREGKIYRLTEYHFQTGKDCGPPGVFAGLEGVNVDGAVEVTNVESCSTGKTCLRYIVKSPEKVKEVFAGVNTGDRIEIFASKVKEQTGSSKKIKDVDLTVRILAEKTGHVRDTVTFSNVPASEKFISKMAGVDR